MKIKKTTLYCLLLSLCTLFSCGDIDSKSKNHEDALKRYILPIINQYNKYADDSLSYDERNESPKHKIDTTRIVITDRSEPNWTGLSSDIKYFLKRKKETLARLDSMPDGKQKFTYKAIRSFLINAGTLNKSKVINELGKPHDIFYISAFPEMKYPERMLQIDSSLCVGIYSYRDTRQTSAMRYYAYGEINKKTNDPDVYIFDFIIGKEDRLIGIHTSKFIINKKSFFQLNSWDYIE